jgi:peptide/nickel transport system ATP-binding protein
MSIILITHNLGVVSDLADWIVVMYAGRIVESARAEEIFDNPRHPYTIGLLQSTPPITRRVDRLQTIAGNVPPATDLPLGCRYNPRCSHVMPICREQEPPEFECGNGHLSRCWLAERGI